MHLNPVREKAETISLVKENHFWEIPSVEALENVRKDLRGIMKYTDRVIYVPDPPKHIDIEDPDIEYKRIPPTLKFSDMPGFRKKVQEVLLKLFDENETLQKIKAGKPVSNTDLMALTSLVLTQNPSVDQDVLKEFFKTATPLDYAIRSIIGMDADIVNERFVEFITAHAALTSSQISFLNLLKNYISRYGSIEIEQLYEPPFTTLHSDGLDGVFIDEDMVDELITIINAFRPKATMPKERPYDIH
jgi:type I restriction enzyme R subunit